MSSVSACDQSLIASPGPPLRACDIWYARARMCAWHLVQPHLPVALLQSHSLEETVHVSNSLVAGNAIAFGCDGGFEVRAAFDAFCGWC